MSKNRGQAPIATGVTNARTEAANTAIKHIKRTGRGYRNSDHYQARILLRSAHRARQHRLTSQGTTANGPYPRILDTGCDYAAVGSVAARRAS